MLDAIEDPLRQGSKPLAQAQQQWRQVICERPGTRMFRRLIARPEQNGSSGPARTSMHLACVHGVHHRQDKRGWIQKRYLHLHTTTDMLEPERADGFDKSQLLSYRA